MSYRDDLLKIRVQLEAKGVEVHVAKDMARLELKNKPKDKPKAKAKPVAKAVAAKSQKVKAMRKGKKVVKRG